MVNIYYVMNQDIGTEPSKIIAYNKANAATKWVEIYEHNQCEFTVASGREDMVVSVFSYDEYKDFEGDDWSEAEVEKFLVKGETVPIYSAEKFVK